MVNNNIRTVLISDDVDQKCVDILENNGFNVTKNIKLSKAELLEEVKVSQIQHCSFLAADNCTQNPEKRHFSISFSSFSPQKFFDHLLSLKLFLDFQANRKQNK